MSTSAFFVAFFPALLIVGAILAPLLARRDRPPRFQVRARPDLDRMAPIMGSEQDAPAALIEPGPRDEAPNAAPLSADERDRYFADWTALQAKFID